MSSPEVESFEITDQDLLDEFNPERRTFRQSKNRATYGVWAEDSDEDERPGFGKKDKARNNFTAPIGFVSGGIKVGDKVSKDGGGDRQGGDSESENDDYDRQVLEAAMAKKKAKKNVKPSFGMAGTQGSASIGGWEKHTKGVASKLMEKMGYVPGKGLGKNLHGISTPVEAKKRAGKGTVGYHGSERTQRSLVDFPTKPDSDEEEEKKFRQELHQWKKGTQVEKKKKPKYVYKTADELLKEGGTSWQPRSKGSEKLDELGKVKVIDMTGKEQRVLTGYHALAHKHDAPRDSSPPPYSQTQGKKVFDMPELLHNLDLLVEMAEDEIIQSDRKLKHNEDLAVNLKYEKEKMDKLCEQEAEHITRLKKVLAIIEECEQRAGVACPNAMDLDEYAQVFKHLQENYAREYEQYNLCELATALVLPIMKSDFEVWEPVSEPRHSLNAMSVWKDLLDTTRQQQQGGMNTYERLIWEVWMPHIRKFILDSWSPREPDGLLEVLEAWIPLLPDWVLTNVLEQLVLPKLQAEVDAWNPLTDTMPIHGWLHPWLPLMGERLDGLYAPIRHKLASALTNWHPSDPSAKLILQPWNGVFRKGQMDAFLIKHISPKLALSMQEFVINPAQQNLDAWNWLMAWLDMVPLHAIVTILQKNFFPKWIQVLCSWLGANPNFNEVSKWYMGWKSMFPEVLASEQVIKEELNKALTLMNRAVSGLPVMSTYASPMPPIPAPQPSMPQPVIRVLPSNSSVPINFKDLLERKAEELGVLFMPVPNRSYEAKQIYTFGSLQIYLDRGVIFRLEREGLWVPVSLNTLFDQCR
jgi:tuftelin-interacting protein 11